MPREYIVRVNPFLVLQFGRPMIRSTLIVLGYIYKRQDLVSPDCVIERSGYSQSAPREGTCPAQSWDVMVFDIIG